MVTARSSDDATVVQGIGSDGLAPAELLEPGVSIEELVELEKIVVCDRGAAVRLEGLGRHVYGNRYDAAREQQANDPVVGRLLDELAAVGAGESVAIDDRVAPIRSRMSSAVRSTSPHPGHEALIVVISEPLEGFSCPLLRYRLVHAFGLSTSVILRETIRLSGRPSCRPMKRYDPLLTAPRTELPHRPINGVRPSSPC